MYLVKASPIRESTIPLTSVLPNFVLVCPSNSGSGTLTDKTTVKPSLIFSPAKFFSISFLFPLFLARLLKVLVKTVFNPSI